jgi:hypothetical protein
VTVLRDAIELISESGSAILTIKELTMAEPVPARPKGGQVRQGTIEVLFGGTEDLNRSAESRRICRFT